MTDSLLQTIRDDFRASPGMVVESVVAGVLMLIFVGAACGWLVGVWG